MLTGYDSDIKWCEYDINSLQLLYASDINLWMIGRHEFILHAAPK